GDVDHGSSPRLRAVAVSRAEPADQALVRMEGEALVHAALETLDPDRRAVFVLHELDECPIPEVARVLEIPTATAYTRLRLAREGFAAAVKRIEAPPESAKMRVAGLVQASIAGGAATAAHAAKAASAAAKGAAAGAVK